MKYPLSKRQRKLYDFIRANIKEAGLAPTFTHMSEYMYGKGKKGRGGIAAFVKILEERGYILRLKNKARSISLVPDEKEEINDLRAVKAAAASFVQVQENFRQAYDSNPADPKNTAERAPMVAKALDMLKGLIN